MRRTAAVTLSTLALCCAASPALAAPGDPVTGYWTRTNPGLPVPVQPPDTVPEGGTWVAADPAGPIAVSALRADVADGLVAVELRLTIADAVGTPAVQACPSTDRFAPEQGGRLEAAPTADCTLPLEAKVDGKVLVVPLPQGLGAVNVLLRPKPGSSFSLTMERATAASVVTQPEPAPFVAPPPPALGPPGSFMSGPAFTSGSSGAAFLPPTFDLPAEAPLFAAPVLPAPAPALPAPVPQAAPAPVALPVTTLTTPRAAVVPESRSAALLAAGVLVLLGVQAARLAAQPVAAPRALGGAARLHPAPAAPVVAVPARGVGRFRRPAEVRPAAEDARGVGRFRGARTTPPVRI